MYAAMREERFINIIYSCKLVLETNKKQFFQGRAWNLEIQQMSSSLLMSPIFRDNGAWDKY